MCLTSQSKKRLEITGLYKDIREISIDIETYSSEDLGAVGVYKYADSPVFTVLLLAYSVDGGPVEVLDLKHGGVVPDWLIDGLQDPDIVKYAFNANFERVCLDKYLGIKSKGWQCTMVKSWYLGITGGLDGVAKAIGLPEDERKLEDGKRLIKKFSMPSESVQVSVLDEEDWQAFIEYNRRDVEVEQKIKEKLDRFNIPKWELELYEIDQIISDRGIGLDIGMIESCIQIDRKLCKVKEERFKEITGRPNPRSLKDLREFIQEKTGIEEKSFAKGKMPGLLDKYRGFPDIVEALEIRQLLSRSSTAKYYTMADVRMSDGRSRGNTQFYGASRTGRWAGRLIQVQNLPRNYKVGKPLRTARQVANTGDYDLMDMVYKDVPDTLAQLLRTAIVPEEGKSFIVSDFSAIEARVIAWYAGEEWKLDVFRDHGMVYEATASKMFDVPIDKVDSSLRAVGKLTELACGYQGSVGALKAFGGDKSMTDQELKGLVDNWRQVNSKIVSFWYETERAVKEVVGRGGMRAFRNGMLRAYTDGGVLFITLPSGRELCYPRARLRPDPTFGGTKLTYGEAFGGVWKEQDTYGGRLVENIVQATARDLLAQAIMRLESEGYEVVMHVHDEVVIEVDSTLDLDDELDKVNEIMTEDVTWATGLPLGADGFVCDFYQTD